jgi:hypothetical protein
MKHQMKHQLYPRNVYFNLVVLLIKVKSIQKLTFFVIIRLLRCQISINWLKKCMFLSKAPLSIYIYFINRDWKNTSQNIHQHLIVMLSLQNPYEYIFVIYYNLNFLFSRLIFHGYLLI